MQFLNCGEKMTGGTPEVRSNKSLTLMNLTFDIQLMDQWTNGPMDQGTNGPMDTLGTLNTQSAYCDKIVPR